MSRKRVFRTLLVVTALSIGFFGSGSVAFAQHLEAADVLVEQADLLIETADEFVEAADQTVESADSAIEAIDLLVEDAIAAHEALDHPFCLELMAAADAAIEALASDAPNLVGDQVLGIMGGADLLVEAIDEIIHDDVLAKLLAAQGHLDNLPLPHNAKEHKAVRAVDAAFYAAEDADDAIEAADVAVENAIVFILAADVAVEAAQGCTDNELIAADLAVESADGKVEDADAAVEAADAAIEAADAAIEEADKRIEKALK